MNYFKNNHYKYFIKNSNKLYTINDVVKVCEKMLQEEKVEWKKEQQLGLVLTVATILNAKPFGFGKKRLTEFFRLLFEQSIWVNEHPEDAALIADTVRQIGLKFEYRKGILTMYEDEANKTKANLNKNAKVDTKHVQKNKAV